MRGFLRILPFFLLASPMEAVVNLNPENHRGMPLEFQDEYNDKTQCQMPRVSEKFAVDTDGGQSPNGSKTYQAEQSYQGMWGGTVDPEYLLGAVNTVNDGRTKGGDIICYRNTDNGKSACAVVFDNGYGNDTPVGGVAKTANGTPKPAEASAFVHKVLGATYANGAGTSLSETKIESETINVTEEQREEIKKALVIARNTQDYYPVNLLLQRIARSYSCSIPPADEASIPRNSVMDRPLNNL